MLEMSNEDIQSKLIEMRAQEIVFSKIKEEDKLSHYDELLRAYSIALENYARLLKESEKSTQNMPSKKDLESMGAMLDLISKIDTTTLEKLNKFGGRPIRRGE